MYKLIAALQLIRTQVKIKRVCVAKTLVRFNPELLFYCTVVINSSKKQKFTQPLN
ncbi:hypothetical protein C7972_12619 [Arenibacter sp. ARW7G5Y1]|nr:hypothetical protein C7972_12619 [Arenibacter sp. ARW7G5Y1]